MTADKFYVPIPVFDTIDEVVNLYKTIYANENSRHIITKWLRHCFANTQISLPSYVINDYQLALNFLYSYRGSSDTFTAYRRDIERFLQWSWFVRKQSVFKHKREDIESFIEFCIKPPKRWIGLKTVARFKLINGEKQPNPQWRPFDVHVSKKDHLAGIKPDKSNYQFSQQALKIMFGILSSFYKYLIQEEAIEVNPIALIRQKSKFIRKDIAHTQNIRRLSNKQWQMVINLAKEQAKNDVAYERVVFILSCLYGMYLRISELVAHSRWAPLMKHFYKDSENNWWFKTVGKGNKARQIAVSEEMLKALKHYRVNYLGLSPYPAIDENIVLISHINNINKPITSDRPIRKLVQEYFDKAAYQLELNGEILEADSLRTATVHWLRHTGISEDVKIRPREHVRDDAGHSSSAITDKYIDIELSERARSAKKKRMVKESIDIMV